MTLAQLRNSMSEKELQLWAALRMVERDERRSAELAAEVKSEFDRNKGRWTNGHRL